MTASGANRVDLTPGESQSQGSFDDPSYSPDGSQIVYTVNGTMQVMYSNGSNQHTLLAGGDDSTPAWSPDGSHLVSTSNRDSTYGGTRTWQMKADGTGVVILSNYAGGAYDGAHSPDGKSITLAGNDRIGGLFQVLTQVIGGDAGAVTAEPDFPETVT